MFESRSHEWSNRWQWNPFAFTLLCTGSYKKEENEKKGEKRKKGEQPSISGIILGMYGNLSSSISGIILGGIETSAKESTFAFKSCIESIFGPEVSWDSIAEKCCHVTKFKNWSL